MERKQFIQSIIGMSLLTSAKSFPFDTQMENFSTKENIDFATFGTVSYTHLDVYKRQIKGKPGEQMGEQIAF